MSRLPISGSDTGTWGTILNDFLGVAQNADGTLKPITTAEIADGAVTAAKLSVTLDQITAPATDVSMASHKVTNLADPTSAQDAASQAYLATKLTKTGDTMTGKLGEAEVNLTDDTTITVDASLGNVFKVTLGGNRTIANPTNPTSGQKITIRLKQDINGSRTVSWDTAYRFSSDIPQPTLTVNPNTFDYVRFAYNSTSSTWDCISAVKGTPNPSTPTAGTMTLLTTHPFASVSAGIKGLHALYPLGGTKLYAGYGDYNANTGPINVEYWNGTSWNYEITAGTESIDQFYDINGTLMFPYIDPRPNGLSYDFAAYESGSWALHRTNSTTHESALHDFAMTYFDGKIWVCGADAGTNDGAVYSATSATGPWTNYPIPNSGTRIVNIWTVGGVLFCVDLNGVIRQWSGTAWFLNGWQFSFGNTPHRMRNFAGKTFYTPSAYGGVNGASLRSIDVNGTHTLYPETGATYDIWVEGSYLYALGDGNSTSMCVMRSTNLTAWEFVALAPSTAESVCVMGTTLYVGTTVGTLYSIALP